jgi:hypothetical protein
MCRALVFDGDGLFHQTPFLELVAVDQRATEASLLVRRQTLCKVCIDLPHWVQRGVVTSNSTIESGDFVFILRVVYIVSTFGNGGTQVFLAFPLATTRRIQGRLLLLRFQGSNELTVDEAVVHDTAGRPVHGIGPSLDARGVLFVHQNRP